MIEARIEALLHRMPAAVGECVQRIRAAGGRAWLVGGVVREALLDQASRDWDLATTLEPGQLTALFPGAVSRDARLGAVTLRGRETIVLTTLREEADYRDHRHPQMVRFVTSPELDARRRDFTINAIYVDPEDGRLLDPTGGTEDLGNGVLRAIGVASARLVEDPLRILRAVRFAARCQLRLEPTLRAAIAANFTMLETLSAERVFAELTAAFTGPGRGRALRLLVETGVAAVVLPEAVALVDVPQPPQYHPEGDVLTHVCLVLDHVAEDDAVQAWAAVLHDIGKPLTFHRAEDRIRFHGHDVLSASMADRVLQRLRAPRELRETVVEITRDHLRIAALPEMTAARRERWLRDPRFPAHLAFHRADCLGSHADLRIHDFARDSLAALPPLPPPPLCTGADILALGVPEGPMVGLLLRELAARLEAVQQPDRAVALSLLAELAGPYVKAGR